MIFIKVIIWFIRLALVCILLSFPFITLFYFGTGKHGESGHIVFATIGIFIIFILIGKQYMYLILKLLTKMV